MSKTLYWQPVVHDSTALPEDLRLALGKRWGDLHERLRLSRKENPNGMCYLEGLRDGSVDGAQALLDAIEVHREVDIWLAR